MRVFINKKYIIIALLIISNVFLSSCISENMQTIEEQKLLPATIDDNSIKTPFIIDKPEEETAVVMEEQNDFFKVLDGIKSTHPGTAGCSLQVLYDANDLLNMCKTKLPLEPMAKAYVEKLDKSEYADVNESFVFLQENLKRLEEGNDKKILDENDVKNEAPYDKLLYGDANYIVQKIIELTK